MGSKVSRKEIQSKTVYNIYIKRDDDYILLQWNDSSQQIQIGGTNDKDTNTQFQVLRKYERENNRTTTQLYLQYAPEKQVIVEKEDWIITAVSKDVLSTIQSKNYISAFYEVQIDDCTKIYINTDHTKLYGVKKNEVTVGVVSDDLLSNGEYNYLFRFAEVTAL